ncbi:hypothetical protein PMAYCL1PPCAC_17547, partial [Pristionchus mayeri]
IFQCEDGTKIIEDDISPIEELFQPVIEISMFTWQKKGSIKRFFRLLHSVNEGKGVKLNRGAIVMLNRRMRWFRIFILCYGLFFIIYATIGIRPNGIDFENLSGILYFEQLLVIYNATSSYLLLGWSIQIHTYCYLIRVAVCEINNFVQEAIDVKCSSESEAISFFMDSIRRNSRLSLSIRCLDGILKRFVFFQIGMAIPCTIFISFALVVNRNALLFEFLPSLILTLLCLCLFYILTIYPARLHNRMKKTRALFCSNIRHWLPFGHNVHTAALVFASHLEQTDLGVTIWGFALLSKPLILTLFSSMITALAIFLQFSDCQKQIQSTIEFRNTTNFKL